MIRYVASVSVALFIMTVSSVFGEIGLLQKDISIGYSSYFAAIYYLPFLLVVVLLTKLLRFDPQKTKNLRWMYYFLGTLILIVLASLAMGRLEWILAGVFVVGAFSYLLFMMIHRKPILYLLVCTTPLYFVVLFTQ